MDTKSDLIWGAKAISLYLNCGEHFVYKMVRDQSEPVFKFRGQVCASMADLDARIAQEKAKHFKAG